MLNIKKVFFFFLTNFSFTAAIAVYFTFSFLLVNSNHFISSKKQIEIIPLLFGFVSLVVFLLIIEIITSISKRTGAISKIFFFFFIILYYSYETKTGIPFDYSVLKDNADLAFSRESLSVILNSLNLFHVFLATCISLASVIIDLNKKTSNLASFNLAKKLVVLIFLFFTMTIIVYLPIKTNDPIIRFTKTISAYNKIVKIEMKDSRYPLMKKQNTEHKIKPSNEKIAKPNIIIIMIESFNANFVNSKSPDGIEYTPFFNSLIDRGLYVENFYGNSIQTCKGQEAVLLGIAPVYKGKIFTGYPGLKTVGLPEVMSSAGYFTVFFQAYFDISFDNTGPYMKKLGFESVKSSKDFVKKNEMKDFWGWGPEDALFYRKFFEYIDTSKIGDKRPIFAVLATVGSHIPCQGMPAEKMEIVKNPQNIRERYSNAIHLSDKQLSVFFEELSKKPDLKNSIIIITSDHSFPMREHGYYNNEVGYNEECFKIPFLMIWDGKISPIKKRGPFSQTDIAPTLLELLKINPEKNHFIGKSIFTEKMNTVFLVQPYNGRYLSVLNYPYKYVKHLSTNEEYMYDLVKDPSEKENIITQISPDIITSAHKGLDFILLNQILVDENRLVE